MEGWFWVMLAGLALASPGWRISRRACSSRGEGPWS